MHFNPITTDAASLRAVLTLCLLVVIAIVAIAAATAVAAAHAATDEETSLRAGR